MPTRKRREIPWGEVYDLIAARQPERDLGARDAADHHGGEVEQVVVILPRGAAIIQTLLADKQPLAVLGPVKRADWCVALADGAMVVDLASIDLDLEPTYLLTRPRHHPLEHKEVVRRTQYS